MKSIWLKIFVLGILVMPVMYYLRPFHYRLVNHLLTKRLNFSSDELGTKLLYRFYEPKIKKNIRYPLIITLHGAAERGDDNLSQIDGVASDLMSRKIQNKYPSFIFIPQCPQGTQWVNTGFTKTPFGHYCQSSITESPEMKMIVTVINQLISQYPIDTSRIYVGGFSMGSSGTWDIIARYPDLFAAAFMISGVSDTMTAEKIKQIPIWAFTGEIDDIAPPILNREMCNAVIRAGGTCTHTVYKNIGHYCVHQAIKEPGFIEWLFSQRKNKPAS